MRLRRLWKLKWVLFLLALAALAAGLVAGKHAIDELRLSLYQDGEFVRSQTAVLTSDSIHDLAVDETHGRLFAITARGLSAYQYPSLRFLRSRAFFRLRDLQLLPHATVVKHDEYSFDPDRQVLVPSRHVLLLHPETLETMAELPEEIAQVASDYESSTLAMLSGSDHLRFARVGEGGIVADETLPFPNADSVTALALLPSRKLVFATNEPALYQLRLPNGARERVAGSTSTVHSLRLDQSPRYVITQEPGTIQVWDASTMRKLANLWVYSNRDASWRELVIERATDDRPLSVMKPHVNTPHVRLLYHPRRRLFVVNDPMPKTGSILFVSADTLAILDRISVGGGLYVPMHLSADGTTLVTATHGGLRSWDLRELKSP